MPKFEYDHTEAVPVEELQVGDVVVEPRHPDRPYQVTRLVTLRPTLRVQVWARSVYGRTERVSAMSFGRFQPGETVHRVVMAA